LLKVWSVLLVIGHRAMRSAPPEEDRGDRDL